MRDAGEQRDVAQPEFGHPVSQPLLVRALADEREPDRLARQPAAASATEVSPCEMPCVPA